MLPLCAPDHIMYTADVETYRKSILVLNNKHNKDEDIIDLKCHKLYTFISIHHKIAYYWVRYGFKSKLFLRKL